MRRVVGGPGTIRSPGAAARTRYLVELGGITGDPGAIQDLATRVRRAAGQVDGSSGDVRFLRLVFVPHDSSCLLLFEGRSVQAVRRAIAAAGIRASRVTGAIGVGDVRPGER